MTGKRVRMTWMAVAWAGALTATLEARAQSGSSAASSAANYSNMTMGMGFLPLPGMFGSATPSATDAAALGMTAPQGGMLGTGGAGNLFMNPMASPLVYGSMFPMTQQQAGVMMLSAQAQMMGIGSGRLSGVRPGAVGGPGTRGKQAQSGAGTRGTTRQPGGLAARYFNRTSQRPHIPQGFYNRPNQHYPQVGR